MQIHIRNDSVEIEGYINSVERKSRPLWSRMGQFVERIRKGAFTRALEREKNVDWLLNHERKIGSTSDGSIELTEDAIGLHARARTNDAEIVEKARNGELVGWSFGFYDRDVENKRDEDGFPLRDVKDLDLEEVSILDNTKTPAYDGTLVAVRSDESSIFYGEIFSDEIQVREEQVPKQQEIVVKDKNYDEYKKILAEIKED